MVLIKPFFPGGSLAREREGERASETLRPSTHPGIPCSSLRNLQPSRNQAMKTPDPRIRQGGKQKV